MAVRDCNRPDPYRHGPPLSANCFPLGTVMTGNDGRAYRTVAGQAGGKSYGRWAVLPGQGPSSMPSRPKAKTRPKAKAQPKAKPKAKPMPKKRTKARPRPRAKAKPRPRAKARPAARRK